VIAGALQTRLQQQLDSTRFGYHLVSTLAGICWHHLVAKRSSLSASHFTAVYTLHSILRDIGSYLSANQPIYADYHRTIEQQLMPIYQQQLMQWAITLGLDSKEN